MELAFEDTVHRRPIGKQQRFNPFYIGTGFRRSWIAKFMLVWSVVSILFIMELAFEGPACRMNGWNMNCFNPFYNGTGFRRLVMSLTSMMTGCFNPFYNGTGFRSVIVTFILCRTFSCFNPFYNGTGFRSGIGDLLVPMGFTFQSFL